MDFYIYIPFIYLFNFDIPLTKLRSYVEEYVIVYFYSYILFVNIYLNSY